MEAKKRALAEGAESMEEKEMVRDVIREVASQNLLPAPPATAVSDDDAQKTAFEFKEKGHENIIVELISLAFSKGLASAMKVANALKNPHVLDEFHDTLADRYYQKLLEARKIK